MRIASVAYPISAEGQCVCIRREDGAEVCANLNTGEGHALQFAAEMERIQMTYPGRMAVVDATP